MTVPFDALRFKHVLRYNRRTGAFTWKNPPSRRVRKGAVAGTLHSKGYWSITVDGKAYLAHRLAWAFCHGAWPAKDIDHVNGNRLDNRLSNLRDVSRTVNLLNQTRASKNSTLQTLGVSPHRGRFKAQLHIQGRNTHLGVFDTLSEASEAYQHARRAFVSTLK